MRYIHKGEANPRLIALNTSPPQAPEEAKQRWKRFKGAAKKDTRKRCSQEQLGLCGYSEIVLFDNDAADFTIFDAHLEHVEPKSKVPQRSFDHTNLILSAIKDKGQADILKEDLFGGHYKADWHEPDKFITPFMVDCATYFSYQSDGRITPNINCSEPDQQKAQTTIDKLNLNSTVLKGWRKNWYEKTLLAINEFLVNGEMDELADFAQSKLSVNNEVPNPFQSLLRQLFGKLAG